VKKILLINPPRVDGHPVIREERQEHADYDLFYPPLSILYTASVLRNADFIVKVIDASGFDIPLDALGIMIDEWKPDVVYIRCAFDTYKQDIKVLKATKDLSPNCVTVLRSKIIGEIPEKRDELMLKYKFIDIFVNQEPEAVVVDLFNNLKNLKSVKGISFVSNGKVVTTEQPPFVKDLNSIPFPAYDLLPNLNVYKSILLGPPFVTVMTCYDDKTEVLTKDGWKFFKDLRKENHVATLNSKTMCLEYQQPLEIIKENYSGKMFKIKQKNIDLVVTPNHKIFIKRRRKNAKFELVEINDVKDKTILRFKKDAKWNGVEKKYFTLPSIEYDYNPNNIKSIPEKEIPMDTWLEFFGYYIADGNVQKKKSRNYIIKITKSEKHNLKKFKIIRKCLDKLGYNYNYVEPKNLGDRKGFYISNKQLYTYLKQFGKSYEKYIPIEIKGLSSRQLKILFNSLMMCDGYTSDKQILYCSSSKKLADDVQEILLKTGFSGNISLRKHRISYFKGRKITAKHTNYRLVIQKCNEPILKNLKFNQHLKFKSKIYEEYYSGKIYCCEVPNHVIYVRRNGVSVWCGNSRGCPYHCSFCGYCNTPYRVRSPENVIKELEWLKKEFGVKNFIFYDDTMTINFGRVINICKLMVERNLKMNWAVCTRVDLVTPEVLEWFKKAGCKQVAYGIESGSQKILDLAKKGITLEQSRQAMKWTKEAGMRSVALVIIGLPGETRETARQTLDFVKETKADYTQFCYAIPFPNTDMYNHFKDNNLFVTEDWTKFNPLNPTPVARTKAMTVEEIMEFREKGYKEMFFNISFLISQISWNPIMNIKGFVIFVRRVWSMMKDKYIR